MLMVLKDAFYVLDRDLVYFAIFQLLNTLFKIENNDSELSLSTNNKV